MKSLLIDDQRSAEYVEATWGLKPDMIARTFADGINALKREGPFDTLFLDHDLGCFDEEGDELTGYMIICFLEEHPEYLPKNIVLVTSNPVGRRKMQIVIDKLYNRIDK